MWCYFRLPLYDNRGVSALEQRPGLEKLNIPSRLILTLFPQALFHTCMDAASRVLYREYAVQIRLWTFWCILWWVSDHGNSWLEYLTTMEANKTLFQLHVYLAIGAVVGPTAQLEVESR